MKELNCINLNALPRVFQTDTGEVNVDILKEIISPVTVPSPSGAVRNLLQQVRGIKLKKSEDPYLKLSSELSTTEFRSRWYLLSEVNAKNGKMLPPLFYLVEQWFRLKYKEQIDWKIIESVFEIRNRGDQKGKRFPKLDQIYVLAEQLSEVSKASLTDVALYAWSFLENVQCALRNNPEDKSLALFREKFIAAFIKLGAEDLLDQIAEGEFLTSGEADAIPKANQQEHISILKEVIQDNVIEVINDPIQVAQLESLQKNLIPKLDRLIDLASIEHRLASEAIKSLLITQESLKTANEAIQYTEKFRDYISEANLVSDELINGIAKIFESSIDRLSLNFEEFEIQAISISEFQQWKEEVSRLIDITKEALRQAAFLADLDKELIQELRSKFQGDHITLKEASSVLNNIKESTKALSRGIAARKYIQKSLEDHFEDFYWNPLLDINIEDKYWIDLGKHLSNRSEISNLLGICTRRNFTELQTDIKTTIEKIAISNDGSLDNAFKVLSFLTLGQIESLGCNTDAGRALLAVFELDSFIRALDKSADISYIYMSIKPVSEYLNESGSTLEERFFSKVFDALRSDNEKHISGREFRQIVSTSELRFLISLKEPTTQISNNQINKTLHANLKKILEYHPGGGPTYAHLRELVYNDVCKPLLAFSEKGELANVAKEYRNLRENFDFDSKLASWMATLSDRLRKQSQYEKSIRLEVHRKFSELDGWLHSFDELDQGGLNIADNVTEELKNISTEIFLSNEPGARVISRWLKMLSDPSKSYFLDTSQSQDSSLEDELICFDEDPYHPRALRIKSDGQIPNVAQYLADEVFTEFNMYVPEKLGTAFLDTKFYEALSLLIAISPENLSLDLIRRYEAELDDFEILLTSKINSLEVSLQNFDQQTAELISLSIFEVRGWLSENKWTQASKELDKLSLTVTEFVEERRRYQLSQSIRSEILALGGTVPENATLDELSVLREVVLKKTLPLRQHLVSLHKILSMGIIDSSFRKDLEQAITVLELPENLPTASRSSELAYLFSETIDVLAGELLRSKNYLPAHAQKLNSLAQGVFGRLRQEGVKDESNVIKVLLETASDWSELPLGNDGLVERLLDDFSIFSGNGYKSTEEDINSPGSMQGEILEHPDTENIPDFNLLPAFIDRLAGALSRLSAGKNEPDAVVKVRALYENCEDQKSDIALAYLTDWAVSILKDKEEELSLEEFAAVLHLLNRFQKVSSVVALLPTKSSKGSLGNIVARFITRISETCHIAKLSNPVDEIIALSQQVFEVKARQIIFFVAFSPAQGQDSIVLRSLWDYYSSDKKQAEARAALMKILWQTSVIGALASCLKYPPIRIEERTADALANIAEQALTKGRFDLLQSFVDLKRTISAGPYQLFVGSLLSLMPNEAEPPAHISLLCALEHDNNPGVLNGIILFKPRRTDSPNSIQIKLPKTSPILFEHGEAYKIFKGPFIDEETSVPIKFQLKDRNAQNFTISVVAEATSITGATTSFTQRLDIEISGLNSFTKISPDDIEDAFHQFHSGQMRGEDYIHRPNDERRIERDLFKHTTIRSIWISSPRRSGKTTMLYRILDHYSYKAGRDNLIAYFSMGKSFSNTQNFNEWLWRGLLNSIDNKEIRSLYSNFAEIGRDLPFDSEVGTFIEVISDRLVKEVAANRIIFLIDEIDKLATMYFADGDRRETALEIAWELRRLINRRRDIGFVFAGSSAAKKIFLTNRDAPFFNAGIQFELSPFSCDSPEKEKLSREVIEPIRLKGRVNIPKKSLEHMIWICSGIPYYMKLLAGATYAVAKQSYILISDVNEGLQSLLDKRTGIPRLDDSEGDPGADELQTIALEKGRDLLLTTAIVYAAAELGSPLTGYPLRRANFYGETSPLVTRYRLTRQAIELGLDRSIEFGLLKQSDDSPPQISFAIPILGESIRHSIGTYWAEIDNQLDNLANELATGDA